MKYLLFTLHDKKKFVCETEEVMLENQKMLLTNNIITWAIYVNED